jgi:hypothetical protein
VHLFIWLDFSNLPTLFRGILKEIKLQGEAISSDREGGMGEVKAPKFYKLENGSTKYM